MQCSQALQQSKIKPAPVLFIALIQIPILDRNKLVWRPWGWTFLFKDGDEGFELEDPLRADSPVPVDPTDIMEEI